MAEIKNLCGEPGRYCLEFEGINISIKCQFFNPPPNYCEKFERPIYWSHQLNIDYQPLKCPECVAVKNGVRNG